MLVVGRGDAVAGAVLVVFKLLLLDHFLAVCLSSVPGIPGGADIDRLGLAAWASSLSNTGLRRRLYTPAQPPCCHQEIATSVIDEFFFTEFTGYILELGIKIRN